MKTKNTKATLLEEEFFKEESWMPCEIDNNKELTILDAIEQVVMLVRGSSFCPTFYRAVKRPLEYLSQRLSLTEDQCALFAIFINFSNDSRIFLSEITDFVNCSQIDMLRRASDFDELKRRHYICRTSGHRGDAYCVTHMALKAVKENSPLEIPQMTNLTIVKFFDILCQFINERKEDLCEYDELRHNIKELLDGNKHLPFVEKLKSFNLSEEALLMFLQGCNMRVNNDETIIVLDDISFLFEYHYEARNLFISTSGEEHQLVKLGLLQPFGDDIARRDALELGRVAIDDLLADFHLSARIQDITQNLLAHKTIRAKQLFYNPSEERQIAQLQTLLQPERFEKVCDKLAEKGMRRGFAVLFHGAPGTGKTETVLQLARITGRDIMQVNISELRDKYVGESEKRMKALFDAYRRCIKNSKIAPILLFNEADAIISKRTANIDRAVDKMENALQTIILQEIENMEGILIATTNLTQNMDKAFERRFLYKVEFNAPTLEAKRSIWQSMLPTLHNDEAIMLATTYNFSGGQIENIARKYAVAQIISESDVTFENIRTMCNEELIDKTTTHRAIGF